MVGNDRLWWLASLLIDGHPGPDPGSRFSSFAAMHRNGDGSDFCRRYGLHRLVWADQTRSITDAIAHEKRLKRWRRAWKFALIQRGNPAWRDLFDTIA